MEQEGKAAVVVGEGNVKWRAEREWRVVEGCFSRGLRENIWRIISSTLSIPSIPSTLFKEEYKIIKNNKVIGSRGGLKEGFRLSSNGGGCFTRK
jgi:hypothetical protein